MKVISLFSGIGGFDLALERLGCRTIAYSEIDDWACQVMRARFPTAVNLGDITKIDWSHIERPEILAGGFPCQDISVAGKGAGLAGARSGLWYEFARAIRELRPRLVLVENVGALLVRGIDAVLGTLAEIGYDASWQVLSAAAVGAPHRRERVWIVAYPVGERGCGGNGQRQDATDAESPGVARSSALAALADRDGRGQRGQRGSKISQDFDPSHRDDADGRGGAARWRTPSDPTKRGGSQTEDKRRAGGHTLNLEDQVEHGQMGHSESQSAGRAVDAVQQMRWDGETPAASPKLRKQRLRDSLPAMPSRGACGDGDMGQGASEEQGVRGLRQDVSPEPLQEPQDVQSGVSERDRSQERIQAVGKLNPDWVEILMNFPVGWTDPAVPNDQLVWTPFPAGPGPQYDWEPPRVTTRKDGRRKRLRCLGNAIVPACLEAILTGGGHGKPVGPNMADTGRRGDGTGQPEREPERGDSAPIGKGGAVMNKQPWMAA